MYLEVRHVVLTIDCQKLNLEKINSMLEIAQDYDFCDVEVALDKNDTEFNLRFKKCFTSVFIDQWVKCWMRPFNVKFSLNFNLPENGKRLVTSFVPAF